MIPAKDPPQLYPFDPKDPRCPYCGARTVVEREDDDLVHFTCPNDSGSLNICPKVRWSLKMDPGRGITFPGQLDVEN